MQRGKKHTCEVRDAFQIVCMILTPARGTVLYELQKCSSAGLRCLLFFFSSKLTPGGKGEGDCLDPRLSLRVNGFLMNPCCFACMRHIVWRSVWQQTIDCKVRAGTLGSSETFFSG